MRKKYKKRNFLRKKKNTPVPGASTSTATMPMSPVAITSSTQAGRGLARLGSSVPSEDRAVTAEIPKSGGKLLILFKMLYIILP